LDKKGYIEIKISGKKGNFDLHPDIYDIRDVVELLRNAEHLIFPNSRKDRPLITYEIQEGSVRNILKTSLQAVIGFNAILAQIKSENYSINFLEYQTAKAFEYFQQEAQKNNFAYEIGTSLSDGVKILINKDTKFMVPSWTREAKAWPMYIWIPKNSGC
jgi:hypothetical protein